MLIEAKVPATVANLGPGFDCVAVAVDAFHLHLTWAPGPQPLQITLRGQIDGITADESNLVVKTMNAVLAKADYEGVGGSLTIDNGIPPARGLGSSAAAIVGALMLVNKWLQEHGQGYDQDKLAAMATEFEGHADNVVAALFGGLTVAAVEGDRVIWQGLKPVEFPTMVLAIPEGSQTTPSARAVLPRDIAHADAAFNVARCGVLLTALYSGRYDLLRWAMVDRLHEPYRAQLYPWLSAVRQAALDVGAYGLSLSGAGPSTVAFVPEERVGMVMGAIARCYRDAGLEVLTCRAAVNGGAVTFQQSGPAPSGAAGAVSVRQRLL